MDDTKGSTTVYSHTARRFHWWTVAFILIQIPLGIVMTYDGPAFKLSEAVSNNLWSLHKALGFILLWLVVARLIYRFRNGAPPDDIDRYRRNHVDSHHPRAHTTTVEANPNDCAEAHVR